LVRNMSSTWKFMKFNSYDCGPNQRTWITFLLSWSTLCLSICHISSPRWAPRQGAYVLTTTVCRSGCHPEVWSSHHAYCIIRKPRRQRNLSRKWTGGCAEASLSSWNVHEGLALFLCWCFMATSLWKTSFSARHKAQAIFPAF
jgi:hypothetical protein